MILEDGADKLSHNVGRKLSFYAASNRYVLKENVIFIFNGSWYDLEFFKLGGDAFFRDVGNHLTSDATSHPRRHESLKRRCVNLKDLSCEAFGSVSGARRCWYGK
jgi:hypothetical protein